MTSKQDRTALVTGANSGIGLEAAAQFAERGYSRIILACRTSEKADGARAELVERTGVDPFETLAVDVSDNDTVRTAVAELARRGGSIDLLLLNAGVVSGGEIVRSGDGVEITVAASLTGHHVLTVGLLESDQLSAAARIVISGSEAARGDVPMMGLTDVAQWAAIHYSGDRTEAIEAIARVQAPYAYESMPHYAMAKLFVAWWAAALSRRLPAGMTVNAVSPGSSPGTSVGRNQGALMRFMMGGVMARFGHLFGMAQSVPVAAKRYVDAADHGADVSGRFFASAPGKMVGEVHEQRQPHVIDLQSQEACFHAIEHLSATALPRRQSAPAPQPAVLQSLAG